MSSNSVVSRKNAGRVAFVDIETAPILGYTWGMWEQNLLGIKKDWYILSFSVKYLGQKKVHTYGLPDYKLYKTDKENDLELCKELWRVFDESDVIVAHNGDHFDIPKANARFIVHGMNPPSAYINLDTKKFAKRGFMFTSNKLDDLGIALGTERKLSTGGFSLWLRCMAGEKKAWDKMKKYNGQDVVALEQIYLKFLPWATKYANANLFQKTADHCPRCGSAHLQSRGYRFTSSGQQARYQCQKCGGWATGKFTGVKGVLR